MRISLPALPFLKPASIPFLPLLGLNAQTQHGEEIRPPSFAGI